MSAGVFPPTSSRSTRPRTSYARAGVRGLCGLHEGAVSQRIGPGISATAAGSAGSHRWFPGGRGLFSPEPAESRMGGLTVRGPTMRLLVRRPHVLPENTTLLTPKPPSLRPNPTVLPPSAGRCSRSQPDAALAPSPPCFCAPFCPAPACSCPSPPPGRRLLRSPHSHPSSAHASWSAENGRSLAAYLARYGEHGSRLRGLMR